MKFVRPPFVGALYLGVLGAAMIAACAAGAANTEDDGGVATSTGDGAGAPAAGVGGGGGLAAMGQGGSTDVSAGNGGTNNPTNSGSGGSGATGGAGGAEAQGGAGGTLDCIQILLDGGFEGGTPNTAWDESSTHADGGTPLCTVAACGAAGGSGGPRSGTWWYWGGGIQAPAFEVIQEVSIAEQTVTIPTGTTSIEWHMEIPSCDTTALPDLRDYFLVAVDGTVEFLTDTIAENDDGNCGLVGYRKLFVDISAYADGSEHTITIYVDQVHNALFSSEISNFFVDDVALNVCN